MNEKGFTLLELLVVILIIGIVVTISTIPALSLVAKNKLNNATTSTKQMIQEAQSYATTKSADMEVVFESDKVTVQDESGNVFNEFEFEDKIIYSSTDSTINSDKVTFNYKGSPLGADDTVASFTDDVADVVLCYTPGDTSDCKYSKTIRVAPITGAVRTEED